MCFQTSSVIHPGIHLPSRLKERSRHSKYLTRMYFSEYVHERTKCELAQCTTSISSFEFFLILRSNTYLHKNTEIKKLLSEYLRCFDRRYLYLASSFEPWRWHLKSRDWDWDYERLQCCKLLHSYHIFDSTFQQELTSNVKSQFLAKFWLAKIEISTILDAICIPTTFELGGTFPSR